jgi:hypothetical protein
MPHADRQVPEGQAAVTDNITDVRPLAAGWLAQGRPDIGLLSLGPDTHPQRLKNAVEDSHIAEHWDVLQEELSPTVSRHPMFTVPGQG